MVPIGSGGGDSWSDGGVRWAGDRPRCGSALLAIRQGGLYLECPGPVQTPLVDLFVLFISLGSAILFLIGRVKFTFACRSSCRLCLGARDVSG